MKISEREKEILRLLCCSNPQIAKHTGVKICTIKTYIVHLLNKFACNNRRELLILAIKEGVIKIEEIATLP